MKTTLLIFVLAQAPQTPNDQRILKSAATAILPALPACTSLIIGTVMNASQFALAPTTPDVIKNLPPEALVYIQIICEKRGTEAPHWAFIPLVSGDLPLKPPVQVEPQGLKGDYVFPTNVPAKPAAP